MLTDWVFYVIQGQRTIRPYWRNYFEQVECLVGDVESLCNMPINSNSVSSLPLPGKPWMSVHHFGLGSVEFDHNLKPGMGQNFAHLTRMIHLLGGNLVADFL